MPPAVLRHRLVSPALFASVVVVATSGLVYELIAGTVGSYVLGDSVLQFSSVIGVYLFAMGVGSYLSRFVTGRLLERFIAIELGIALVGGASAPLLFGVYTALGAFRAALYLVVFVVGALVGLEIPLLIRLLEFRLSLKDLVARVLSLDYIGALIASLLFPLVFVPRLGLQRTSLLFGILNAGVAFLGTFLLPVERVKRLALRAQCLVVAGALAVGMVLVDRALGATEAAYFGAPVVYAEQSPYQRIVLTRSTSTTRLFLNGNLQFSSDDEHRYHEVLVHPAVAALGRDPRTALVLGGGDGLAVRELLRYPAIERIVLVDLDGAVTRLFSTLPLAVELNRGALSDPRVEILTEDAYGYVERAAEAFDLAVVDFPDPANYAVGKLYTASFYERLRERVGMRGVAVVQATSPYFARESFWSIVTTLEAAGWTARPLHAYVPSFGEWGYVLCGAEGLPEPEHLRVLGLRFLEDARLPELFDFPRDMARVPAPVNRLSDQRLVPIYAGEWTEWPR
ncbi:MAG: polyamine aminopropyltransferase [Myxococcales bacterium]|nr:polyamine aminopropyltransferase [Myxococcales bacterium]